MFLAVVIPLVSCWQMASLQGAHEDRPYHYMKVSLRGNHTARRINHKSVFRIHQRSRWLEPDSCKKTYMDVWAERTTCQSSLLSYEYQYSHEWGTVFMQDKLASKVPTMNSIEVMQRPHLRFYISPRPCCWHSIIRMAQIAIKWSISRTIHVYFLCSSENILTLTGPLFSPG